MPSHTSTDDGPGVHVFTTPPCMHDCWPVRAHAPTPQVVVVTGNLSSGPPTQSSSTPSQLSSGRPVGWHAPFAVNVSCHGTPLLVSVVIQPSNRHALPGSGGFAAAPQ